MCTSEILDWRQVCVVFGGTEHSFAWKYRETSLSTARERVYNHSDTLDVIAAFQSALQQLHKTYSTLDAWDLDREKKRQNYIEKRRPIVRVQQFYQAHLHGGTFHAPQEQFLTT